MGTEKFCLKWNDFESNISHAFREIREEKDFFDVTLACDDEQLQAHKVILSACSPFFRKVLKRNPHQHPLLYLKGVKYTDLQSVLNFMYHGEVNVAQDELNSFLAVAEELRVKGLTQNNGAASGSKAREAIGASPNSPQPSKPAAARLSEREPAPPPKRPRPNPPPPAQESLTAHDDDEIQEVVPVKSEPRDVSSTVMANSPDIYQNSSGHQQQSLALPEEDMSYGQDESYDDYGQYGEQGYDGQLIDPNMTAGADGNKDLDAEIGKYMYKDESAGWTCSLCRKSSKTKKNIVIT